ncbi:MAG: hypothetical protein ACP5RH_22495 [Leptodesmis sp.]|uniref:hypothetical protein n=1 Tax=Leptodesmis sp. TaxID=3100501 RepID=UPI003D126C6B
MSAISHFLALKNEVRGYLDAKKVLPKIGGKRPGKKCGKSYIAADRKCKSHYSESGKLTEEGKASAQELAGKVRARKGLSDLKKPNVTPIPTSKPRPSAISIEDVMTPEQQAAYAQREAEYQRKRGNEANAIAWEEKAQKARKAAIARNMKKKSQK